MSTKYLGPTFDIHGGGVDLIFPHHENEIAVTSTWLPSRWFWSPVRRARPVPDRVWACDVLVRIPIRAATESLNAGLATGIALYEVATIRSRGT